MDDNEDREEIFVDEEVLKILKESLKQKLKNERKLPNKVQLNNALKSSIAEFLDCFKIFGYDLNGDLVDMTIYKTKMEKSALDNLFVQKFGEFMAGRVNMDDV
jgi:hypothetical protein